MEAIFTLEHFINFITLSGLEIVLGIDNIIFIAIIVYHLPRARRLKIQFFGISLAILLRIVMLFGVSWVMSLTKVLFSLFNIDFSGRSLLLLAGGLFLVIKSAVEIADLLKSKDSKDHDGSDVYSKKKDFNIILQIIFVDLVLSFDSVIVAVGMVNDIYIIICAILVAMVAMLISAKAIGEFMHENPSIKVLGLAFVLLIGVALILNGFSFEVPKGYLYFAMFFSLFVEIINIKVRKRRINSKT